MKMTVEGINQFLSLLYADSHQLTEIQAVPPQYDEGGTKTTVYKSQDPEYFWKLTEETDSYTSEFTIGSIQLVKAKEKTVLVYE